MRSIFNFGLCEVAVVSDAPRAVHDRQSVMVEIIKHMPTWERPADEFGGIKVSDTLEPRTVASISMTPSQARALASAILSAATEAKG